jgi:hypothetical protein
LPLNFTQLTVQPSEALAKLLIHLLRSTMRPLRRLQYSPMGVALVIDSFDLSSEMCRTIGIDNGLDVLLVKLACQ